MMRMEWMALAALVGCSCGKSAPPSFEAGGGRPQARLTDNGALEDVDVEAEDPHRWSEDDPSEGMGATREERALRRVLGELRGPLSAIYRAPSEGEAHAHRAWVSAAARAARTGVKPLVAAPEGFVLEPLPGRDDLWLLAETREARRGAGAIVLRTGAASEIVVEAPHTCFDKGTLPIAIAAFEVQTARALFINTLHRLSALKQRQQVQPPGHAQQDDPDPLEEDAWEKPPSSPSDLAHAPRSFFQAAHEALLTAIPGLWTAQLHGFHDDAAPGVWVILSAAGTSADTARAATSMRTFTGERGVRVFPQEIGMLGGLSNVQAKSSARAGAPFFHVEMSRTLRDQLVRDADMRRRFAATLTSPPVGSP